MTQIKKYLYTGTPSVAHVGQIYTHEEVEKLEIPDWEEIFIPIEKAKWAVKRTPENADVVNKWANEKTETSDYTASSGYIHSKPIVIGLLCLSKNTIARGYIEISFDTFKEIVGIEEEKKGTWNNPEYVPRERWYTDSTTKMLKETEPKEQPTEEWQPKWVSVDKYLPDVLEKVYIVLNNGNQFMGRRYNNGWSAFYADGEKSVSPDVVTHWMPLLQNPKTTGIPMSEALEIVAKAKGINVEQIKIVE